MSNLQKYFLAFHDVIKLTNFEDNQILRDKRDMLLEELANRLPADTPPFAAFDQGSYAMNTGTNPKDGNYDIDVGLVFDRTSSDYPDPVELKKIVRDSLSQGKRTIHIRRPCVTVEYMKQDTVDYHVDLAIYAKRPGETVLDLAKGKEFSAPDRRVWERSDPKGLISVIKNCQADEDDRAQMRRCVRYLKRWRDHRLISGKPYSIALTCAVHRWFQPDKDFFTTKYNDLNALLSFVESMLYQFDPNGRLVIELPIEPYNDLNGGMTDVQMQAFKEKLGELKDALRKAHEEDLVEDACRILQKHFGDEFPIPDKKDTAKKAATAGFVPAGVSA